MSKTTPLYGFLYLQSGDIIYSLNDQNNMQTVENQLVGAYNYLESGITGLNSWQVYWMGCLDNAFVLQQRQSLLNAYRTNKFSYLGLEYQSINYPITQSDWNQCIVVSSGTGILIPFYVQTEYSSFFRFTTAGHYYVYAETNACTQSEHMCQIVVNTDPDYILYNSALYIAELYVQTQSGEIQVTQITYSSQRIELSANQNSSLQILAQQALVAHVHSGENNMPSKINLSDEVFIDVPIIQYSNTFQFGFTTGFIITNYAQPQVYLNSTLLNTTQYQIVIQPPNNLIYLQNYIPLNSTLQIVYKLSPGPVVYITNSLAPPLQSIVLNYTTVYYLTDGSTNTNNNGGQQFNVFTYDSSVYSEINVYLNNQILDPATYIINQQGLFQFNGPILPSIDNYTQIQVVINFVTPSFQVTGLLPISKVSSISANSLTRGTVPSFRLNGLDHLGFFRINEPANIIPYKKLLDSGDHIHFYPEINSPIQHSDVIIYSNITQHVKIFSTESNTPSRTVISTPNGVFISTSSPFDYGNIVSLPWNTDNGVANIFSENYFGNFITYNIQNFSTASLNPGNFWVLSKSINQFQNLLYLSRNFGIAYDKIILPINSLNVIVTVNDFIYTVNVFETFTNSPVSTPQLNINYIYYLACTDGLYTATLTTSQNATQPAWMTPSTNTTNSSTGSINNISEAVNVGVTITNNAGNSTQTYVNYRTLYASCDSGLFVYSISLSSTFIGATGTLFTTNSNKYNQNNSKFNYIQWLGIEDATNVIFGVVWGDGYGVYYSNSGQEITQNSSLNGASSTVTTYRQALMNAPENFITANVATIVNLDLALPVVTIDNYTLIDGNTVLVKNQINLSQNGVYIWSASTQMLFLLSTPLSKIYVENGSQAQTEWIDLTPTISPTQRNYALWFANLINLNEGDYIVGTTIDRSSGPTSAAQTTSYYQSFFVATTQYIYRVLCYATPNIYPIVIQIYWDANLLGLITNIQHYASSDIQNGTLVVLTTNGIYQSTPGIFSNTLGATYQRFINSINPTESANASVYDDYTYNQYIGKIKSIGVSTSLISVPVGTYLNLPVFSNNTNGQNLTVDIIVSNGTILASVNNPGFGYSQNLPAPFVNLNGQIILLQDALTEGTFTADSNTQALTYSVSTGINPSRLLYESDYTIFYIQPWAQYPLIFIQINGVPYTGAFTYNSDLGQILFPTSLTLQQLPGVTITLSNVGQYISNAGNTPHLEVFNIIATSTIPAAVLSSTYNPITSSNNILPIDHFDNTLWMSTTTVIKVTGMRAATSGSNILTSYTEIVQVSVNEVAQIVYIVSKPTTLPLTQGSDVYIGTITADTLGIEDQISLYMSNLTYHLNSISHVNVYNLSNTLLNVMPNLYQYPVYTNEVLTGVNRGLQNTLAIRNLSDFDPTATFTGYTFGVSPSSLDVAASPSIISGILNFSYGNSPLFSTDKGIWEYIRLSKNWTRVDAINNSNLIYFANKTLTDSTNTTYVFSGTNSGLYYQVNGIYTQNPLFTSPTLSINMGAWYNASVSQRYEAYGQSNVLSFALRTTNSSGSTTLQSDYFQGHNIYDIYYNVFYRYDDSGNQTIHPAIYLATDDSVWAFTTDEGPGSLGPSANGPDHTLLVGREMFGNNILRNINILNSLQPGIPVKVFKILPISINGATGLVFGTSNGVYVVINWQSCDVGSPQGLPFYPQNLEYSNATIGRACYVFAAKTNDLSGMIFFTGTDSGVFKSIDGCNSWGELSKFNNQQLSINDLTYILDLNNNGYLIAATNIGLWVSDDDGDSWSTIQSINDLNIAILSTPTYGISINESPTQTFQAPTSGLIFNAFTYLNTNNLTGPTNVALSISNGTATTQSSSLVLTSKNYPGMYGFAFTNVIYSANQTYKIGIVTDKTPFASGVTWEISNLDNPFPLGVASYSGGQLSNEDFYFLINLNSPAEPTQIIEPVGFYNNDYQVGFATGTYSGASISSTGALYSNVGIICNVILDTSQSIEINDTGVITISGVSTDYVMQAVINSLIPTGLSTDSLYTRLSNNLGISKFLCSVYGFNNTINDLIFYSTNSTTTSDNCFISPTGGYDGYTNNPTLIQNSINYVTNNGRLSALYDSVLFNSRLQYPAVINGFYSNSLNLIDANFINVQSIQLTYENNFEFYLSLNLVLQSGNTYNIIYQDNSNNFVWPSGAYVYSLVLYSNGTCAIPTNLNPASGILIDLSGLTPIKLLLSKDWQFDTSLCVLSSSYNVWSLSIEAVNLALSQYARSFKPLIIVTTDGNDNSMSNPIGVNSSLRSAWTGSGTQVLIVEPSNSGNEINLRTMIEDTNSELFSYSSYPEQDIRNILYINDNLDLFTSYWARNYDFDTPTFISYIFSAFTTPGNSTVTVEFQWSSDRINFSNFISIQSSTPYYLNQQVLAIYYKVQFTEDYQNSVRLLPFVSQLYHILVIPAIQTYLSYPQSINGQLFEALACASFNNDSLATITPIVGRTASIDSSCYEQIQLNRNAVLSNRQTSFRITAPYTVDNLELLPLENLPTNVEYYVVDSNGILYPWEITDIFVLYGPSGLPVSPSAYTTIPESAIVVIPGIYSQVNGIYLYENYSAVINYSEKNETIIGEPTTTNDYKTYSLFNGKIPIDATLVVLINQIIYHGLYEIDYFNGLIVFASSRDIEDYVTVFIKFADTFRVGLLVQSYSLSNLNLQSFNFTYTSLPDGATYNEAFGYSVPYLIGSPNLTPSFPMIDSKLQLNYQYVDQNNTPENNSTIQWFRYRSGIEYTTFNSNFSLSISGAPLVGLNTFIVTSLYNQNANPFILSVTLNSVGITTNITQVQIIDRGSGFIGVNTSIVGLTTIDSGTNTIVYSTVNNLGVALTAFTLSSPYSPGFALSNGYIRINPNSPIGYANTTYGNPQIVTFPNYDGRINERAIDIAARTVFDERDLIYCTVIPSNGFTSGQLYQSNIVTMQNYYTPIISNLSIVGSISSFNGISTSFFVSASNNQVPIYSYYYPIPGYTQNNFISWYALSSSAPILLSTMPTLSSSLINLNDQIFYSVFPGVIFNNHLGYGNTGVSPVFEVTT